jgi:hypothetical protein
MMKQIATIFAVLCVLTGAADGQYIDNATLGITQAAPVAVVVTGDYNMTGRISSAVCTLDFVPTGALTTERLLFVPWEAGVPNYQRAQILALAGGITLPDKGTCGSLFADVVIGDPVWDVANTMIGSFLWEVIMTSPDGTVRRTYAESNNDFVKSVVPIPALSGAVRIVNFDDNGFHSHIEIHGDLTGTSRPVNVVFSNRLAATMAESIRDGDTVTVESTNFLIGLQALGWAGIVTVCDERGKGGACASTPATFVSHIPDMSATINMNR